MKIAFFGHDSSDAAVKRRITSMLNDGLEVTGFMMHRRVTELGFENIDLGQTFDGRFVQRLKQIWIGARKAIKHRTKLETADVIYARNLDMLLCAFLTKAFIGLKTPVIYESLDVHRLLTRGDMIGRLARMIEGHFLKRSKGLVVSSPGFIENHFEKYYSGTYKAVLVENRWLKDTLPSSRPVRNDVWTPEDREAQPLSLGWVGILRCQRSLDLMCQVAEQFKGRLMIHLHGIPALVEVPNFEAQIASHENIKFFGRFSAPEDLAGIYEPLDLVWAGDFMEAGSNSEWLLPNRIYEGGYFAVPPIAPNGTQTERWITERQCGFGIAMDVETSLPALLEDLSLIHI